MIAALGAVYRRSSLLRNSLALISGTVVTQAIVFLFSPILSRLFGLADFGDLANYNAWVAILAVVSNLRYEHAIIVAKGRREINRVIVLVATLSLVSCLAYAAAAGALYLFYTGGGYLHDLRRIVLYIPIGVLAVCLSSLFIQFNVKTGRFRRVAMVAAVQVCFTVLPQIALDSLGVDQALILGTIGGFLVSGIAFAWMFFREHTLEELWRESGMPTLRATAGAHLNFPRFTLSADALAVLFQQFVPVFILALFSPAIAGMYAFSLRVVRAPMLIVAGAVTGALRKQGIDAVHGGVSLAPLFRVTLRSLFLLAIVPFLVIAFQGPRLFGIVFGSQWIEAGHLVQILSPGILLEFVATPISAFFLVTDTQRYTFVIQLIGFILMLGALVVGRHVLDDFVETAYLISAVMVTVNLLALVLGSRATGARHAGQPAVAS